MSPTGCIVRPMRLTDLPFIKTTIQHDAHSGHYHRIYTTDGMNLANLIIGIARGLEGIRLSLRDKRQHSLIGLTLECDQNPCGFAAFTTEEPERFWTELWLMSICPDKRGRGFGKRLIDGALAMPQIEKSPLLARCHPPSTAMMSLLRHRGFQMLGTGPEGTHFLGRNIPQWARIAIQRPH
jgi:GNAT superfamily N-acetyltransferase